MELPAHRNFRAKAVILYNTYTIKVYHLVKIAYELGSKTIVPNQPKSLVVYNLQWPYSS